MHFKQLESRRHPHYVLSMNTPGLGEDGPAGSSRYPNDSAPQSSGLDTDVPSTSLDLLTKLPVAWRATDSLINSGSHFSFDPLSLSK